jgi:hypothetical protein
MCITYSTNGTERVFSNVIAPGQSGYVAEPNNVICGTFAANTMTSGAQSGPGYAELRNARGSPTLVAFADAQGTFRLSIAPDTRPPVGTYACVRTVARNAFFEFVRPGETFYVAPAASPTPSASTGPQRLPSTSTLGERLDESGSSGQRCLQ